MNAEAFETFAGRFDEAFFLIGAAVLAIELISLLFKGDKKARTLLDAVASFSTQIPFLAIEITLMTLVYAGFVLISESLVSWAIPTHAWTILLVLVLADLTYYWEHRFAHEIRLLWTQHAVHHSSRFMNISVAIRFGPLESLTSAVFHLPLIVAGFDPALVFGSIILVQAYQTWIHTELIGKLGPLDAIFNTPANHRVHHGCDDKYLDKNYGGILMIWDRMFGTYQREEERPNYGLARDFDSVNPIAVWFSELPALFGDLRASRNGKQRWQRLFGRPGWSPPDG